MKVKSKGFGKDKKIVKKKRNSLVPARKRFCRFCADKTGSIDYKDIKRLEVFITERGKINSSRFSGNCAKHQRMIKDLINKARFLSLLPYTR
ncbi:MAG: 30S ribosomal protein S18 [Candidatus Omnitrophica bacterium]|jgi:small subunit ribosomal protein S18|nr:30S ribosomal protein S18 [Candidatus Omnitrophota bacterium]MDD3274538.1 30S ribosomal protein S18 [Candidatus Omnitrophota bacterium]MDD5078044.1 30S ribosomal protein S18 [Candidatus Omnitrophota bacterium]MDD5725504.1 30S ribosomal protein S18 [Candidatus Omnitrophota bacterium]